LIQNDSFIALVPYWATWPFEALILSKSHVGSLDKLNDKQRNDFAAVWKDLLIRYDNLFETSFPYSAGIHQSPFHSHEEEDLSHFHMHFYPPLLRSATVKKFMVGYEMLANPQRDLTAEVAVQRLREVSGVHYKQK